VEIAAHPGFLRGIDLFNRGEFWEAHEAWESAWNAARSAGDVPSAAFAQGLIWCAAAWVKRRAGEPAGAVAHAGRVADRMAELRPALGERHAGVLLEDVARIARLAAEAGDSGASCPPITRAA
jgi:hypothetical protein